MCGAGRWDNCSASPLESKHLDVKRGSEHTNSKHNWLIQVLLRSKRGDDGIVLSNSSGEAVRGAGAKVRPRQITCPTLLSRFQHCTRQLAPRARDSARRATVLLLDCLADKTNPWIQGNPGGDMAHLPHTLAKYVQDTMWRTVQWIPAPSIDRRDQLDTNELRDLLLLVTAWDPSKPRDGELAIYNSLRIAVPGAGDQQVRVCVSSCHVDSDDSNILIRCDLGRS